MPFSYHMFYPFAKLIGWIVHLWGRWQVRGKENVPKEGPLVVVANHVNLTDIPLLGVSLGRKAAFIAKEELFHSKFLDYFMHSIGSFPVRRGQIDRKAIRKAQQLLAEGRALVMFPEGTRSKNAQLQSAFSGSVLLALRSGAPILPVGMIGTEQVKSPASILRRPKITINIGHPFYLPPVNNSTNNSKLTKETRAELTNFMMQHIAELLPPEYQGNYVGKSSQYENRKGG